MTSTPERQRAVANAIGPASIRISRAPRAQKEDASNSTAADLFDRCLTELYTFRKTENGPVPLCNMTTRCPHSLDISRRPSVIMDMKSIPPLKPKYLAAIANVKEVFSLRLT